MSEVENKCFFEFQVLIKWNSCKTKKLWLFHVYSAESYWWNHGRKSGLEKLSTNIGIYKSIASKLLNFDCFSGMMVLIIQSVLLILSLCLQYAFLQLRNICATEITLFSMSNPDYTEGFWLGMGRIFCSSTVYSFLGDVTDTPKFCFQSKNKIYLQ